MKKDCELPDGSRRDRYNFLFLNQITEDNIRPTQEITALTAESVSATRSCCTRTTIYCTCGMSSGAKICPLTQECAFNQYWPLTTKRAPKYTVTQRCALKFLIFQKIGLFEPKCKLSFNDLLFSALLRRKVTSYDTSVKSDLIRHIVWTHATTCPRLFSDTQKGAL